MQNLTTAHQREVDNLTVVHQQEIQNLINEHQRQVQDLKATYQREIHSLSLTSQERLKETQVEHSAEVVEDTVGQEEKEREKEYKAKEELERQEQEELAKQKEEERRRIANDIRLHLDCLGKEGKVPLRIAQQFIKKSTWWLGHSSGQPIPAPGHYRRIQGSEDDWYIEFGNNSFLVGRAIWRCRNALEIFIDRTINGDIVSRSELVEQLVRHVRGAVATGAGYEYQGYYPLGDKEGSYENDMVFGTTSIDTSKFVSFLFEIVPVKALWDK